MCFVYGIDTLFSRLGGNKHNDLFAHSVDTVITLTIIFIKAFFSTMFNQIRILSFSITLIAVASTAYAQSYGDCATAKEICKKQTYKFDNVQGIGKNEEEAEMTPCFMNSEKGGDAEMNSAWIKFKIEKSGTLGFAITPYNPDDDIDFVVYRLPSGGNCNGKQIVRCMASGDPDRYSNCMGSTGLRSGELDSSEDAGCADDGDNAWLTPLKTASGEEYVILASNVTESGSGFSITFSGSATLPCDDEKKPEKPAVAKVEPKKKPQPVVAEVPQEVVVKQSAVPSINTQAPKTLGNRNVEVKKDVVRVNTNVIKVSIWDDGIEDGDIVSVYVNDEKVLNKISLRKKARIFNFTFPKDEKELYFTLFSDSFGEIEPNTATVKIDDGNKAYVIKLESSKINQQSVKIVVD